MALSTGAANPMMDPLGGLISDVFPSTFAGWPYSAGGAGLAPGSTSWSQSRHIPIDVIERDTEYVVRCDIPGVERSEIKVSVDGDILRIGHMRTAIGEEASKREKKDLEEPGFYLIAERASSFRGRNVRMPPQADMSQVKAKYENGVLSVAMPKKERTTPTGGKEVAVE